ncbi:RecX family transcriptional regulator [bacterium]|nr:RecX family transcriptional regulator [bacterium]
MEILNLKLKSKNNANVFICSTDVGEFELHSDIIVKSGIKVGNFEDEKFYSAVQESSKIIAFNVATKYISSKLKTEQQIKDYLYKKEYHKHTVDAVIEKLKEYKIIDDKNYAETYARSNPNFSKNKLKQKLFASGVKSQIVEDSLIEVDDFSSCKKNAEKYLRNKMIDKQTIDKMIRRLQSMGYTWDTIKSTLNAIKCEVDEY